ncbi:MAG TPA: DUF5996 family protein [Rhodopila sp.]|nr:DUF5996 family protein [Rhodopila sp.]
MAETQGRDQTSRSTVWPSLPLDEWRDTYATVHLWTQIIGKIRLARAPQINHWWQVPLYVTCRGLTTSPIPYGSRTFQIDVDFIDHRLVMQTSDGVTESFALQPQAVADFYSEVMSRLRSLGLDIRIWTMPSEIPNPIPFEMDRDHRAYDPEFVHRFWRILVQVDRIFTAFRARFAGKVSPVHFFWGSFDLVVTRFSGRRAPAQPNADRMTREGYSHEVSSCGFWPGGSGIETPAFYCYAAPQPAGFDVAPVRPAGAFYSRELGQFILPYDDVRQAADPNAALLEFLQTTYEAAANLAQWERTNLEYTGLGYWERAKRGSSGPR